MIKCFVVESCGKELRGLVHIGTSPRKPPVIIIHGYLSSNKIGPNRLYYLLAQALNNNGHTVVRCDLRGMGESEGDISDIRFMDHVQDVRNILKAVSKEYQRNVILVGHSCGCWTALENLLASPEQFARAVLIAPLYSSATMLRAFFDDNMIVDLKMRGYTYRNGLYVSYTFFDETMALEKVCAKLKANKVPLSIFVGDNDQYVQTNDLERSCEEESIRFKGIAGGDHNFLAEASRTELINEIVCYLNF